MPKPITNLAGQRFGLLTAIAYRRDKKGRLTWLCQCDCGGSKEVRPGNLNAGAVKSCGCLGRRPMVAIERATKDDLPIIPETALDRIVERSIRGRSRTQLAKLAGVSVAEIDRAIARVKKKRNKKGGNHEQ